MEIHGKWPERAAVLTAVILAAAALGGCGQTQGTQVEGLDKLGAITAVTREADSGTRASFDDLTGITAEAGERTEAASTDEMKKAVAASPAAIGYLTVQAAGEESGVRVLTVDGRAVTADKYPLTRQLYLVYKGELSDLEREFIAYVTGAGQAIVGESFEQVNEPETFLSLKPAGELLISGSSSEAPVMEELAKAYMEENPNADISVETTDSGAGINAALEGASDLGMSSRSPKDYEKELLTFVPVAKDRIAVIVQADNPLTDITTEQLASIYTGKTKEWAELNP